MLGNPQSVRQDFAPPGTSEPPRGDSNKAAFEVIPQPFGVKGPQRAGFGRELSFQAGRRPFTPSSWFAGGSYTWAPLGHMASGGNLGWMFFAVQQKIFNHEIKID